MAKEADSGTMLMRVRGQLAMLTLLFLLGMAVNLLGEPETAFGKALWGIFLGVHVLIAIGVLVGTALTMQLALKAGGKILRTTRVASAGVGIAFLGGILTLTGPWNDLWSYVMAAGFLVALVFYGLLYMQVMVVQERKP
jgi:hypothetical protein